ncbi:GNAT family acetyltransferase [Klebsiella pneumoniae]|nr:GNAT family acetyltransferase [Klebsiella pneumoniae]
MATEAHWLLMQYVFDTLGYRRYDGNATVLISHQPGRQGGWGFSTKDVFARRW